jgi:hypothetical protein
MQVPEEVQSYAIWVTNAMKTNLPNALLPGISFPYSLVKATAERQNEPGFTPAFLVADNILATSGRYDFLLSLRLRHEEKTGNLDLDLDEVQGYVDIIAGFTCWSMMEAGQLWDKITVKALFEASPILSSLPEDIRKRAIVFVEKHSPWVRPRIKQDDIIDGQNIMGNIAARIASETHNASYKLGAQTAWETFTVYVALIMVAFSNR